MSRPSRAPTVVLAGRPNVGKSTLFNRITGQRRSIVAPVAGTTRDVIAAPAVWRDRPFTLVDTGGLFGATTDPLHAQVVEHGLRALDRADLVVFVLDAQEGLVPADEEIAGRLRQSNRPVIAAVNKTDDRRARSQVLEFYRMGFEPVFEVAAEHGDGVYELLDAIVARLPSGGAPREADAEETRIAIVGRPNVGKSSLLNRLLREERAMVNPMPGTTRDPVEEVMQWRKRRLRILDTAGMRRPGRVARSGQVESVSVVLARRAMARADVVVLVVDATEGATDREGAIAGEAERAGCGIVIAVNKWDLVRGRGQEWVKAFDDRLRFELKFLEYAPIVHVSALTGERTPRLVEVVDRVAAARRHRVPTPELNRFLAKVTAAHPPTSRTEREVRILYGAQTGTAPPSFVLFTNVATEFHFSYERFLVNQLREAFGFEGTPIRLTVRRRARRPSAGAGRRKTRGESGPAAGSKPAAGRDRPGKG
jgi:GTP-binding protein